MTTESKDPVIHEVREIETTRYCVECPNCGEWHENDVSQIRRPAIQCICGATIRVTS